MYKDHAEKLDSFTESDQENNGTCSSILSDVSIVEDPYAVCNIFAEQFSKPSKIVADRKARNIHISASYTFEHASFFPDSFHLPLLSEEVGLQYQFWPQTATCNKIHKYSWHPCICCQSTGIHIGCPITSYLQPLPTNWYLPWKTSCVVPIHKKGNSVESSNYRPISIIPCLAKHFDISLHKYLLADITHYLPEAQHGFILGKSMSTNLTLLTEPLLMLVNIQIRSTLFTVILARPMIQWTMTYFLTRELASGNKSSSVSTERCRTCFIMCSQSSILRSEWHCFLFTILSWCRSRTRFSHWTAFISYIHIWHLI